PVIADKRIFKALFGAVVHGNGSEAVQKKTARPFGTGGFLFQLMLITVQRQQLLQRRLSSTASGDHARRSPGPSRALAGLLSGSRQRRSHVRWRSARCAAGR